MKRSRVDRAFERFRALGDPRALARVFDATAPELMRLALHLTADRHAAEDLVQATFLAAIEDARSFRTGERVLPWLCGILANRARDARRRGRMRPVAPPLELAETADPSEVAAGAELQSAVGERVRALPEPYRRVLILHLEHGLGGKEIAEVLERPPATVRSQLLRGLDRLRRSLPAGLAAGGAPGVELRRLRRVRALVLARAGLPAVTAEGTLVTTVGVVTMKKIVAVAVVLVLAVALGRGLLEREEPVALDTPAPEGDLIVEEGARSAQEAPEEPPSERAVAAVETAGEAKTTVVAVVRWAEDGTPASAVGVRWLPRRKYGQLHERAGRTDAAGRVRFEDVLAGEFTLTVDRGVQETARVRPGQTRTVELEVPPGVEVRGRVLDPDGRSIAGASVWLSIGNREAVGNVVARTGADGSFVLREVQPGRLLAAWAEGFAAATVVEVEERVEPVDIVLTLEPSPGTLLGLVLGPHGAPLGGAAVLVGYTHPGLAPFPTRYLRTDESGRFVVQGLRPGYWPVWVRAPHYAPWHEVVELAEQGPTRLEVRLVEGATVSGRVLDADGLLAGRVWIRALHEEIEPGVRQLYQGPGWALMEGTTDAEGRFALSNLLPGRMKLRAQRDDLFATKDVTLLDGQHETWEARLGSGSAIRGTVVGESGTPLSGWRVLASPAAHLRGIGRPPAVSTDERGWFELVGMEEEGIYEIGVSFPGEHAMNSSALRIRGVRPGELLEVTVPDGRSPSARFSGRILDRDGGPLDDFDVRLLRFGQDGTLESARAEAIEGGRFTSKLVLPGRYFLRVDAEEHGRLGLGTWEVAANETADIGAHRYPAPGALVVELVGPSGERVRDDGILLRREGEPEGYRMSMEHGVGRIEDLQPGRYVVSTRGSSRPVEIASGDETRIRLVVPDCVPVVLRWPPIERDSYMLHEVWRDASGAIAYERSGTGRVQESYTLTRRMPPGRYTLEVRDAAGASATIEVVATDPPDGTVFEIPRLGD